MTVGTVTVKLPRDLYARLDALAKQERTDLVELLSRLAASATASQAQVEPSTAAFQRILARPADLGVSDLAEQHDHYLYGTEKQ
jgi:predicted transcriptional regulator